jgi:hypothetical protein
LRIPEVDFSSGLADGAWLLHGLVMSMRPSVCVEIGSAKGCSACYIGLALRQLQHGRLFAIDPHTANQWNDSKSADTYERRRKSPAICPSTQSVVQPARTSLDGGRWMSEASLSFSVHTRGGKETKDFRLP